MVFPSAVSVYSCGFVKQTLQSFALHYHTSYEAGGFTDYCCTNDYYFHRLIWHPREWCFGQKLNKTLKPIKPWQKQVLLLTSRDPED